MASTITHGAEVLTHVDKGVATISINRPHALNAMAPTTISLLTQAFESASADHSVAVIVLTGVGGKSFCVGADRSVVRSVEGEAWRTFAHALRRLFEVIRTTGKPVIARVDGWCLGGGHELHCFCDLTVASDRSVFGQIGPRVGAAPLYITQMLTRIVGDKRAKEIMFLCKRYTAAEALDMGLVNFVVPADDLDNKVDEVAGTLLGMSPTALRLLKFGVMQGQILMDSHIESLIEMATPYFGSAEQREAVAAFEEKREPDYRSYW